MALLVASNQNPACIISAISGIKHASRRRVSPDAGPLRGCIPLVAPSRLRSLERQKVTYLSARCTPFGPNPRHIRKLDPSPSPKFRHDPSKKPGVFPRSSTDTDSHGASTHPDAAARALAVAAFIRHLRLRRAVWGYCCLAFGWPAALAVLASFGRPEAMVGVVGASQMRAGSHGRQPCPSTSMQCVQSIMLAVLRVSRLECERNSAE